MDQPRHSHPVFHGTTGEMVDRVRNFDWPATPLGPMDAWPAALRIAVGICMSSRFPMFVWWGPEFINIYNDAYVPYLGAKHPQALGRPAQPTWAEIWDVVGTQADAVMRQGEATWNERVRLVMARHGYAEETWFTWSYSPIYDETGAIRGMFCACYEETPAVKAEKDRDALLRTVETERERLAEAFTQSPSFLAVLKGPEHAFEFVNERYYQLLGRRDIVGRTVRAAVPEAEGQGFFEILDRVYATGEPFVGTRMRLKLRREAGRALEDTFLDFVYQPMRDRDGKVTGILVHGVDVTERHRVEVRDRFLLSLEDELRRLVDPAQITATGARLLGDFLEADRCAYADVEADQDTFNLVGDYNRGVPSIVGRYRFADFGAEVLALMRAGAPYVVDDVDRHQPPIEDPSHYRRTQVQAVICVPLLKGGRLVAAMAVHQKVPRAWTPAEVELVEHVARRCYESIQRGRVENTLRQSEMQFRQLADAMPQIVFAADSNGHVDYFNRQWYEYTGIPQGEVGFESWKHVHTPEGLRDVAEAWPEALRTGQPYELEYPLRRRDGQYRWHLGRALPIRDESGKVIRWFGTNTDIHDRKQIEDALGQALHAEQHARSEAEMASRMKDEFLATLSHELRTPLNAILGWSHMIRREGVTPAQLAHGADVIERNARAQAKIIEDLLDMSAIISGKVRLDVGKVDVATLVRTAIDTARPTADAKHIRLQPEIEPAAGVELSGDPHRLQQVLWNLLSNAIKFTPRNGQVRLVVRRTDGQLEICVSDTGEGIAPEFLPFVFDRFRQADATTTRKHGGLGLGLSIVKQLVELHGGTVRVESEGRGHGATFLISLPLAGVPPEAVASAGRRDAGELPRMEIPNDECERIATMRVLVVDDEADARELVRHLLQRCGAAVLTAGSSGEALKILKRERFDAVVSDIAMPGEDGYGFIRKMRALPADAGGETPAIALTAYARPEDRVRAIRAGFQMHAAKPIEPAELVAMVASLARR